VDEAGSDPADRQAQPVDASARTAAPQAHLKTPGGCMKLSRNERTTPPRTYLRVPAHKCLHACTSPQALAAAIRSATGGLGVDTSFEAAGLPATFESAMQALRKGGRLVMVGLMPHAGFDAFRAVNDELTFTASVGYRHAYEDLLRIVASGALDLTSIVTRTVSLEDAVADGFDALLADRTQIKILVSPAQRPARRAHTVGSVEHESSVGV